MIIEIIGVIMLLCCALFSIWVIVDNVREIKKARNKVEYNEKGKPLIRHCKNCKWHCNAYSFNCDVTYKYIPYYKEAKMAKRCKYFEVKK